jgi:type IV pilus assembly protein PilY1
VVDRVLWEFTDPDLGFSYSLPVIVKTKQYGWTLILSSGYNNSDGRGYFFMVNPRTGALLQKVSTGVGTAAAQAGLADLNAYVLDRTDGYADAVYGGDLLGNLWRLDITKASGSYDTPVNLAKFVDGANAAQPITAAPMVEVHPTSKKRYVMVGTGRYLDASDTNSTQGQSFYAVMDGDGVKFNASTDLPSGVSFPIKRSADLVKVTDLSVGATYGASSMGWVYDFGNDSNGKPFRSTLTPETFQNIVTFSAFALSTNPCDAGANSRVYAVDFGLGKTLLKSGNNSVNYVDLTGRVVENQFLSVNGEVVGLVSTDDGKITKIDIENPTPALQKLNWREITLTN